MFSSQTNAYPVGIDQVRTDDGGITLGTTIYQKDPNDGLYKGFMWVKYDQNSVAATVGAALGWVSRTSHTVTADVSAATASGTSTYAVVAGVVQRTLQDGSTAYTVPADTEYFWMQIYGPSPVLAGDITGTSPAVGDSVVLSATDSLLKVDPVANQIAGVGGYILDATASANTVFLNCRS